MTGLDIIFLNTDSVKNIVISPNFLMWKFCGIIIINSLFFVDKFTLYNTSYFSNEKKIFFLILINN